MFASIADFIAGREAAMLNDEPGTFYREQSATRFPQARRKGHEFVLYSRRRCGSRIAILSRPGGRPSRLRRQDGVERR